jgi:hypothetical protein|tara:strand:- start:203 stop:577 length:375 start_codon:yes stop_codon:yes gene_type:complete
MLNPQNDFEPDFDVEKDCYRRLKSVPYSLPPAEFNWELAAFGYYSKLQKERSDKALAEFEKELQPSNYSQTAAFEELKKLGVYTEKTKYNLEQAENGFYTKRLKSVRKSRGIDITGRSRQTKRY